jgi:hypothetical protein
MAIIARPPCDEVAILAGSCDRPALTNGGWIIAATILGSSMAFIDGTVVNVALPALQSALSATISEVQWTQARPSRSNSSSIHLQTTTIDPEGKLETAVDQAFAIVIAFLLVYLYAASRNWVWCPGWLLRLVMDEKKRSR